MVQMPKVMNTSALRKKRRPEKFEERFQQKTNQSSQPQTPVSANQVMESTRMQKGMLKKREREPATEDDKKDIKEKKIKVYGAEQSQAVKEKTKRSKQTKKQVETDQTVSSALSEIEGAENTEQEMISVQDEERNRDEVAERQTDHETQGGETGEEEGEDADQYVLWVQCSRPECGKWRRLDNDTDPSALPEVWTCQQSADPAFGSCSVPEENISVSDEEIFYNLVPGSLVWARQIGYPWWPAIIERDPDTERYLQFHKKSNCIPYKCHVTYFGTPVTRAWIPCSRVKNYAELSEDQIQKLASDKNLEDSILMAKEAVSLSLMERLVRFGFWSRYVSDRESSEEDSEIAEFWNLFCEKNKCKSDYSSEDVNYEGEGLTDEKQNQREKWGKKRWVDRETGDVKTVHEKKKKLVKKIKREMEETKENKGGDQMVPQSSSATTPPSVTASETRSETNVVEKRNNRKQKKRKSDVELSILKTGEKKQLCNEEEEGDEEQDRLSLMILEEE